MNCREKRRGGRGSSLKVDLCGGGFFSELHFFILANVCFFKVEFFGDFSCLV